ncbi:HCLS1-associated protein X-1 [Pristis pectinata]|uniref:HCLS1-associated protein X-1 n=1 Tax=Pristis pectinata TaxID=685728 RepID=UPI00223E5AFF|nr:HCLS1-associated protein X-1 [Pristis pectinata]
MSLFGIFRGLFGFPERGGDPFYRGTVLDEEGDDDEDFDGHRADPFGFGFGPSGQPFGEGFSGLFREMDELFKGIGSWDVPMGQFEFPDIDTHPLPGGSEEGVRRRAPRDWMLKQPDSEPPGFSGEAGGEPRPGDRPTAPYRPPWNPSRNFEDLWDSLRKGEARKQDQDLDSKVTSEGLESALKPAEPQSKSYFKSISISKIVRPDGTVEERRTERDGEGNEETKITRVQGEQSYTTVTRRDAQGREEQTEQVVGMDDRDLQRFAENWDQRAGHGVPGEPPSAQDPLPFLDRLLKGLFWSR